MKREDFKPYQPFFCLMVFAILGLGFYQEHVGRVRPVDEFPFPEGELLDLEPLHVPGGTLSIAGRIFDAQGQPAAGVQISLRRAEPLESGAEPVHWTLSDSDGRYRFQGLQALEYSVLLYLAGVPLDAEAARVTPPLDAERDFTLAAPAPPVEAIPDVLRADLSGKVQLPAGRLLSEHPLTGYDLVARPMDPNDAMTGAVTRHATLDASGLFTFSELAGGPYRLELLPPWGAGGSWPVVGAMEWEHQPERAERNVNFALRAGAMTGVVLDLAGLPVQGAVVLLWPESEPGHVWPLTQTDDQGRVTIVDLPAGRYVVRVRAGAASGETLVEVREAITAGITFDALDLRSSGTDD